ncbi:hypothetical protein JXA80_03240, partial [bacterium]|nr:hypothetical protein [candidate division CSSED10-310 bacterium]
MASYLLAADIRPPRWLATAIAHGIRTDTQEFSRGTTNRDHHIYLSLFSQIDHVKLYRISHPTVDTRYLTEKWTGIRNARIWQDVAVSYAGKMSVPDLTSHVADFLLDVRGVCYALVSGFYDNSLYFSLRVRKKRRDAGTMIRKLIGRKGSAGGHGFMAGAQILSLESEPTARATADILLHQFIESIHPDHRSSIEPQPVILDTP